jgi:aminopeptidase-like protein
MMPDVADATDTDRAAAASGAPAGATDRDELDARARRLFPIRRSLTGPGVRETLAEIGRELPLTIHEVPSGTPALDWTVPREWTLRAAWVEDPSGRRIIDVADHPLHVVGYSVPIDQRVGRAELLEHLHGLPDRPDWIPYRTSYYRETWGFCAPQRVIDALPEGEYRVVIDADLADGSLTYGEWALPGETDDWVLLTTHICHPGMANDNVSGMSVVTALGRWLAESPRRLSYRLLFLPGTIGSLTWLSRNRDDLERIRHGITIAGVGDRGGHAWKQTEAETAPIDRAVALALRDAGEPFELRPFSPWGYDERQFNAPGFRLPVGLLSRTPHGTYPEYHTSGDDLDFIDAGQLAGTLDLLRTIVGILERDRVPRNLAPFGEPQLGRRGLYSLVGGHSGVALDEFAILWVLNQADGAHRLLDIAERSGLRFDAVAAAADALERVGLLETAAW